jgi:hypothetical protein
MHVCMCLESVLCEYSVNIITLFRSLVLRFLRKISNIISACYCPGVIHVMNDVTAFNYSDTNCLWMKNCVRLLIKQ